MPKKEEHKKTAENCSFPRLNSKGFETSLSYDFFNVQISTLLDYKKRECIKKCAFDRNSAIVGDLDEKACVTTSV